MNNSIDQHQTIEIVLTYQGKSVLLGEINLNNTVKHFIKEVIRCAQEDPEMMFNMPETDMSGHMIRYFLTRDKNGKMEILKQGNRNGEEMTLFDYGIKEGDELIIAPIPIA
jgi:hypothetical protein